MLGLAVDCIRISGSGLGCVWIGDYRSGLCLDQWLWVGFCGLLVLYVMVVGCFGGGLWLLMVSCGVDG